MTIPSLDDLKPAAGVALGFMTMGAQAIDRKYGAGYAADTLAAALSFELNAGKQ